MTYLKQHRHREGQPPKPPRFGRSWGDERPLPLSLTRPMQPLHAALAGDVVEGRERFGEETIAAIAHYTLGLMRYEPTDLYALHRPAPSPRCLYASQLYYLAPRGGVVPHGLYRFHPARHCLESRPRAEGGPLERWLEAQEAGREGAWLVSSAMDRIGYLYGRFAARLSLLESGHVISQLRMVSGALGVATEVEPCFKLPLLSEGLGEGETPLALIRNRTPAPGRAGADGRPRCSRPWMGMSLYRAMLQRHSSRGMHGVLPAPASLCAADIAGLAWYSMEDARGARQAEGVPLDLYLVVSRSDDLDPGIYRWNAPLRALERICSLPPGGAWATTLFRSAGFAARHCPMICVIAADIRGACQRWGEQGYFQTLEQAGQVAQRLSLAAAGMGLFARPAVSLDEATTDRMLGLHLARETAFYTVLIGRDRNLGFAVRMAL